MNIKNFSPPLLLLLSFNLFAQEINQGLIVQTDEKDENVNQIQNATPPYALSPKTENYSISQNSLSAISDDGFAYYDYGFTPKQKEYITKKAHETFPDSIMKKIIDDVIENDLTSLKNDLPPEYASTYTNTAGYNHTTFIMLAAGTPNLNAIRYLISMGADINKKNDKGYNSLSSAIRNPYNEVLRTLLEYSGNPNSSDHGEPLLLKAYQLNDLEKFNILLNFGAFSGFTVNNHSFVEDLLKKKSYSYLYYIILHSENEKNRLSKMTSEIDYLYKNANNEQDKFYLSQIYFSIK